MLRFFIGLRPRVGGITHLIVLIINLHLMLEQNYFVNLWNNADLLAFFVIMMTGDQGKDLIVGRQ
jgi:hypothetical protein